MRDQYKIKPKNHEGYSDPTAYQAIKNTIGGMKMEVKRGDVFFVKKNGFISVTGSEQEQGRPAVIVSNDAGNRFSDIVEVVWLTTRDKKPMPTHAEIVCREKSTALCEQITSVSKARLSDYVRTCTDEEMEALDRALAVSIGLDIGKTDSYKQAALELTNELKAKLAEAKEQSDFLKSRLEAEKARNKEILPKIDETVAHIKKERDLYKELYEYMLEKVKKGA